MITPDRIRLIVCLDFFVYNRVMISLNYIAKTLTFTALLLAVSSFLSRILGLFRDNLLANLFTKAQTDIYFTAFRIPDLLYGILITGGIVAAFLPVFSKAFKNDSEQARGLVNSVLTFFLLGLIVISVILCIFTPQLIKLIAPGFDVMQMKEAVNLTRIMFLSPILLGSSAILSGVLQYFNMFIAYALAPILYNIGIIAGILFLVPVFGLKGLAFGVILGALMHLLIHIPSLLHTRFFPKISFKRALGLKSIFMLMAPRIIGAAAYHINLIVITAIASTLSVGAISVFNFSNNIQHVLIGLIGISFATAVFPLLSKSFIEDKKKFITGIRSTFSKIVFLIIPFSVLLFLLRAQITRFFLGTRVMGSGLDWTQTQLIAASLGVFSLGLFAATLVPFLAKVFFSMHNTKTPVKIAIVSMVLNICLCFFFVWLLSFNNIFNSFITSFLKLDNINNISVIGLVLGLTVSTVLQMILLVYRLKKRLKCILCPNLKSVVVSTFLMGILVYASLYAVSLFANTDTVAGIFIQLALAGIIGVISYFGFSFMFDTKETKDILRLIFKT